MNKIYRSKIDTWIGAVLGGAPMASAFGSWQLAHAPVPGGWIIAVLILLLGVCLPLSILFFTTYRITDAHLTIRSGVFTWKVPVRAISRVEPTRDPVSSPALSLDRIRIEYGSANAVLISPVKKDDFLRELRQLGVPGA